MFGFGVTEMVLVAFVAILLFPPRELPKIAREIARLYGYARRTADQFRSAILEDEELNKPIREIKNIYHETRYELRRAEELAQREMAKVRMEARMAARTSKKPSSSQSSTANEAPDASLDPAAASHGSMDEQDSPRSSAAASDDMELPASGQHAGESAPRAELGTAGDADAPPPHRTGTTSPRAPAPPPTLRKPAASVPRGTVTPHGASRATTESPTPRPDQASPAELGAPASAASPPSDVGDSAAGAA